MTDSDKFYYLTIGGPIFAFFAFAALVLFTVATPLTWFVSSTDIGLRGLSSNIANPPIQYQSLWEYTRAGPNSESFRVRDSRVCPDVQNLLQLAEACAIISIVGALVSFILGLVYWFTKRSVFRIAALAVGVFTFCTALVGTGGALAVYGQSLCGQRSLFSQNWRLTYGAGLFIAGWLALIPGIIALIEDPGPLLGEGWLVFGNWIFLLTSFILMVFTIIGTAVTQLYYYPLSTTSDQWYFTLWSFYNNTNGMEVTRSVPQLTAVRFRSPDCTDYRQWWQLAEAFAILSIFASVISFLIAVLLLCRRGSRRAAALFGTLAWIFCLVVWATVGYIFYTNWSCTDLSATKFTLMDSYFSFGPGFALFVAAFLIGLVGVNVFIFATWHSGAKWWWGRPWNWVAAVYLFMLFAALVFCIIGAGGDFFVRSGFTARISLWHERISTSSASMQIGIKDFTCQSMVRYIQVAGAFAIMSCFFIFIAAVAAVYELVVGKGRIRAAVLGLFASFFPLVTWTIMIGLFYNTLCFQPTWRSQGFGIAYGLALFITAWCITFLFSIIRFFV